MSTAAAEAYNRFKAPQPVWAPPLQPARELTHADRCDQCGAAAYVRAEAYYSTLALMFCGHHFTEHERNGHFSPETHTILDERPYLIASVKAQYEEDTTNYKAKK